MVRVSTLQRTFVISPNHRWTTYLVETLETLAMLWVSGSVILHRSITVELPFQPIRRRVAKEAGDGKTRTWIIPTLSKEPWLLQQTWMTASKMSGPAPTTPSPLSLAMPVLLRLSLRWEEEEPWTRTASSPPYRSSAHRHHHHPHLGPLRSGSVVCHDVILL